MQRNEPLNVGVILLYGDTVLSRFVGERPDGTIDGRTAKYVRSVPTYKAWVDHWRSWTSSNPSDAIVADLTGRCDRNTYALEVGGEVLLGAGYTADPHEMLDDLFTRLVDDSYDRATESIYRLAETVIDGVQRASNLTIQRESLVTVRRDDIWDELRFDYRYNNGRSHLMQRVSLSFPDQRSWDRVHAVAWQFQQVHESQAADLKDADLIALVRLREDDKSQRRQVRQLEEFGHVIDLRERTAAQSQLAELITA